MEGACPGTTLLSETWSNSPDGLYGFGMLMPGTYCILPDPLQQTLYPASHEITVGNDQHLTDVNFYLPNPAPTIACSRDLGPEDCAAAGGKMTQGRTTAPYCECP
jgi:hypothetical protein